MIKVELDAFHLMQAVLQAERLTCFRKANDLQSHKIDKGRSLFEIEYIGQLGEHAVKQHCKVKLPYLLDAKGDGGTDIVLLGYKAQIKTVSSYAKVVHFGLFQTIDEFNSELLIGVQIVNPNVALIHGFITKNDFKSKAIQDNFGYGQKWNVPASSLTCLNDLRRVL